MHVQNIYETLRNGRLDRSNSFTSNKYSTDFVKKRTYNQREKNIKILLETVDVLKLWNDNSNMQRQDIAIERSFPPITRSLPRPLTDPFKTQATPQTALI